MMQSSDDPNRGFVTKAMKAPMLEAEFEKQLATRWRDDEDEAALHELTTAYMRLVIAMASKFR
ncbi:MAG: RNA polymerase factor sigma-32, partial [Pseudomonadota bacterium]